MPKSVSGGLWLTLDVPMQTKTVLSLFDHSGSWSRLYRDAGHNVIQIDIKLGIDILTWDYTSIKRADGVLIAVPCTDFTVSGAQYWAGKDADGRTSNSVSLVKKSLEIVRYFQPDWWALENPVGRIDKLVPELQAFGPWYFQPHWFGDAYTKKTGLWGTFNRDLKRNYVDPEFVIMSNGDKYSPIHAKTGGKSERTKELRSITPPGFAQAFYQANCWRTPNKANQADGAKLGFMSQGRFNL